MVLTSRDRMKYLSLAILLLQNTALVLTMRYSRTVEVEGERYLASTAVVLTEFLKLSLCIFMVFYEAKWNISKGLITLYVEIVQKNRETLKVSIPSVLYTIQNNLLYVALTYLDAATFQVTYQLKILTTALFSVTFLGRSLSLLKWIALVLLTVAVALVQFSKVENSPPAPSHDKNFFIHFNVSLAGILAVLASSITSGFAGVYTEKILKGSDTSMWIRNIQLALLSFCVSLFGAFVVDGKAVMENGFFQGYSSVVAMVICLQALGGLVVAVVIKYADNILKGFVAALSIVFSSVISYYFLNDFIPTWYFVAGAILVLVSAVLYSQPNPKPPSSNILPSTAPKII